MYHQLKEVKGKKYHYLIENLRVGPKKWKKFQVYLGAGKIPKKKLDAIIKEKTPVIEEQVDSFLRSTDHLYNLLTNEELNELETIRNYYNRELREGELVDLKSFEEDFITRFTYDSNAIEGSTLNLQEVSLVLHDHISPEGAALRDISEAENHAKAFEFVKNWSGNITKEFILEMHRILMQDTLGEHAGKIRDVQVIVRGAEKVPPKPEEVEPQLDELLRWHRYNKKCYNPIIIASYLHVAFEGIHPFRDGNGRVGRLLLNFILLKNRYPLINIENKERGRYMKAVESGLFGELRPMAELILKGIRTNKIVELCAQAHNLYK